MSNPKKPKPPKEKPPAEEPSKIQIQGPQGPGMEAVRRELQGRGA